MYKGVVRGQEKLEQIKSSHSSSGPYSAVEWLNHITDSAETKLSYFMFIDQLNRFGRVFNNLGEPIPLYYRIYFYRNKIVEHWDAYGREFTNSNGTVGHIGKILVPIHGFNGMWTAETDETYINLKQKFNQHGVSLPAYDSECAYEKFSEMIFSRLEEVDAKLRQFRLNRKTGKASGIPDDLVRAVLEYGCPTPIQDVEAYIDELLTWARSIVRVFVS